MKDLNWLDDDILALLELKEDLLFKRLTKAQVKYYIEESRKIAKDIANQYKTKDIRNILSSNNVEILIKDNDKSNLDIRAEIHFDDKVKKITIYKNSINQLYVSLKRYIPSINLKDIVDIHLAHEFYHFLEYRDKKYTNEQLKKITTISLGPIKRCLTILRTREIAANEFCREILNLKFNPKILDYLYLIDKNKEFEIQLEEEIDYLRKKYLT